MRRFKYVTGSVPEEGGEGVQFKDGRTAYRELLSGQFTTTIEGTVSDIFNQYGAQNGFKFTWLDGETEAKDKGGRKR